VSIGKIGLDAYWAEYHGVPIIMVVGDDMASAEAKSLNPEIETAIDKQGLSQLSVHHIPLPKAN